MILGFPMKRIWGKGGENLLPNYNNLMSKMECNSRSERMIKLSKETDFLFDLFQHMTSSVGNISDLYVLIFFIHLIHYDKHTKILHTAVCRHCP